MPTATRTKAAKTKHASKAAKKRSAAGRATARKPKPSAKRAAAPAKAAPSNAAAPAERVGLDRARAFWHRRQGLATALGGPLEDVMAATGWGRTLGGIDIYLELRARAPGMTRADLDRAVAESRVQVVPSVRGCIYLVPRAHVPLALRVAEELSAARNARELALVGVRPAELDTVGAAVTAALRGGPLSTDALRRALPDGVVRSFGEKGKKLGLSSTLPPALRVLELAGKVERTLEGGRLDTERYLWRATAQSPYDGARVPDDPAARHAALAAIFFRQAGPATVGEFCGWSGIGMRAAAAAAARVPLVRVAVDGWTDDALVFEDDLPALRAAAPGAASVSFLAFEDGYLSWRGGPALLVDPRHHGRPVAVWGQTSGKRAATLGEARHLAGRSLLVGELLAGQWEYDPDARAIVWATFDPLPAARRAAVEAAAAEAGRFIRDDLGHARSFSLDTDDEVRARAAAIRRA
jgi:hypothetical protein